MCWTNRQSISSTIQEHIQAVRKNKQNSRYTQHILEAQHLYDTIDQTMEILHNQKKDHLLNTLERFHTHNLTLQQRQMNDTFTDANKPAFDIIIKSILLITILKQLIFTLPNTYPYTRLA
jgi:BarA-like signal transduction histidine kinase